MELQQIKDGIARLRSVEGEAKELINTLAFACMDRVHEHHDVDSASLFLVALSPLNQKKVKEFFDKFSGHKIEEGVLGKRKAARTVDGVETGGYDKALADWHAFKETGLTFWQWAVKQKAKVETVVDAETVRKQAKKMRKLAAEAKKAGVMSNIQLFEELTGGVFSAEDMLKILQTMIATEAKETDKAVQQSKPTAELATA